MNVVMENLLKMCSTGKILLKYFVMGKFARMYSAGKILLKCGIYFRSPLLEIFPICEK